MQDLTLAHGNLGIERETLRSNPDATLATTPHPTALGSAYTHANITTDYAETLLELVTDPHPTPDAAYAQLLALHRYCAQHLGAVRLALGADVSAVAPVPPVMIDRRRHRQGNRKTHNPSPSRCFSAGVSNANSRDCVRNTAS